MHYQHMVALLAKITLPVFFVFLLSCDSASRSIGPRLPKEEARKHLESLGISEQSIRRILDLQNSENFLELSESPNDSVRYLIAKNPFTPITVYEKLMADANEFVRQGAASSVSIDMKHALLLSRDRSDKVQGTLVGNPFVAESLVLEIYQRNRNIPLAKYAMNPFCPKKIKEAILKSTDREAKQWLSQKWAAEVTNSPPVRRPGVEEKCGTGTGNQ